MRSLEFEIEKFGKNRRKPHFAHSFTVILVLITHRAPTSVKGSITGDISAEIRKKNSALAKSEYSHL